MRLNILVRRHGLIDHAQKLQPLLMAVFLLAEAVDLAIGGVQRGEQSGRAVHASWSGRGLFFEGQAGLCTIQSLNLTLLIHGQDRKLTQLLGESKLHNAKVRG
jgi:hypothetical protein